MEPHSHGGDAAGWITPVQTRDERPWSYDPADFGAPVRTDPAWRYSDLDRLAPLFDASGVTGATVADGDFRPEDLVVIEAPEQAVATVVIEHAGAGALAENVEILVRPGAELTLVTLQLWDDGAVHSASHQAVVQRGATLKHVVVTLGGAAVRVNPSIRLEGDGAQAQLLGLAFADAGQHFESQVFLHHVGRHTRGNVTYKGALQGASARTVWIGDVLIGPDATGTDTYEQNRNLVLTEGARADSIPNLEIETGEIEGAGHASATGRFDDEQLFYLRARGIPEAEARRLVVLGFLAEVIQQIPDAALQERLTAAVEREMPMWQ